MANYTSSHTGATIDSAVTKIAATNSSATELNLLDGVTATTAEINIIDGSTSATGTTLADADRVVVNDNGTMVQVALTDFETYFETSLDTLSNVTTVGALNSGSITSGFGSISNGSSAITTTGTITYGSLSDGSITITAFVDEDNMSSNSATLVPTQQSVKAYVDTQITAEDLDISADSGSNIAIDLDSEVLAISGGEGIDTSITGNAVTIAAEEATSSNKGVASFDSTDFSVSSGAVTLQAERIQDIAGAMFSSNTESGITVTYQDGDGTIDLTVGTLNQDTTGTSDNITVSANNSTNETVYPIFVDGATGSQGAESDTGLTYNPSSGILTATQFTGNVTGNVTGNTSGTAATVTGAAQSAITSLGTLTTLTVDNVIINGTTIGHTSDTDLITLADGNVTIAGELDLTTLDVSGDADIDGTLEADAYTVAGTALNEYISDTVGAMVSSNTESGITVAYQDGDNTLDFTVGTLNQDTTGTASKVTVTDSTTNANYPVVFHDEGTGNVLLDDTGALRYNPSTGELLVPKLTVAGTTTTADTVTMEAANAVIFEGATADAHETTLSIVDPTADRTQYLINQTGYIPLLAASTSTAITSTPAELNVLDGYTGSVTELNYLDTLEATGVTNTEFDYLDGVTSNIQTQLDATLDTAGTGIDISSTTVSVDVSDFMANGADNRVLTATGTDAMNAEANLTFDGTTLKITTSDGAESLRIHQSDVTVTENELLGEILFTTADTTLASDRLVIGAIKCFAEENFSGANSNEGSLAFYTTNATDLRNSGSPTPRLRIDEDGHISIPADSAYLKIGASDDLQIYHDGTNSYIDNATGDLTIRNYANDKDIIFQTDDDSGGVTNYLQLDGSELRATFNVHTRFNDNKTVQIGSSADLQLYHDASNSYIAQTGTGDLIIQQSIDDKDIILKSDDGGGGMTAYLTLDGSSTRIKVDKDMEHQDSVYAKFGTSDDFKIHHSGSHSYIQASGTGHLYIEQNEADNDIKLRCDDGSGGTTDYILIDGSASDIKVYKDMEFQDSVKLLLGTASDLEIYHDGTNSVINNTTGDLQIYNNLNDKDIVFLTDDGSGGTTAYLTLDGSETNIDIAVDTTLAATKKLYFDGGSDSYIHETSADNVEIVVGGANLLDIVEGGTDYVRVRDDVLLGAGSSLDMYMLHTSGHSYLYNGTGNLNIVQQTDDADLILMCDDGSGGNTAYLTLDGSATQTLLHQDTVLTATKKLILDGVASSGTYIVESSNDVVDIYAGGTNMLRIEESGTDYVQVFDNTRLTAGTGKDLEIYHDGSNNYIKGNTSDQDIYIQANDGGSNTTALQIDASDNCSFYLPNDNQKIHLGAGFDLRLWHDGSNSIMYAYGTGHLYIGTTVDDANVILVSDDGSGGTADYLICDGGDVTIDLLQDTRLAATKKLYLDGGGDTYISEAGADYLDITVGGALMLRMQEAGTDVTHAPDNVHFGVGDSTDFYMKHDGTNSFLNNNTGILYIDHLVQDTDLYIRVNDGGSTVTALQIDASNVGRVKLPNDNQHLTFGADDDMHIMHESNTNYIATYAGNLVLEQHTNDADIIFNCDDGSGGVTAYLTLDGSLGHSVINKNMRAVDSVKFTVGAADDASFYHDGTDSYLENGTGNFLIRQLVDDGDLIFQCDNGSGGNATYLTLDGGLGYTTVQKNMRLDDNVKLLLGGGSDVQIYHDGSNGSIQNNTGQMYLNQVASANMFFSTNNTIRACITNTGELLVSGNDTDIATVAGTGSFQVLGTGGGDTTVTIGRFSANSSPPTLSFAKSRNGTIGGNTIVADDDNLGQITFSASDGTDMVSMSAKIECEVDGTPGSNDTPGRLVFFTTADGAAGSTEHFRIAANGDLTATDTSIASNSDLRLKKNIENFEGGLDIISKLQPRNFEWRNPEIHKEGTRRGFIAQEVKEVDGYWINTKKIQEEEKDYEYVKDTKGQSFVSKLNDKDAMYVSAIQELKEEIDLLKANLEQLKYNRR